MNAGTANRIKLVHVGIANPPLLEQGIPLEPHKISSWDAGDDAQLASEAFRKFPARFLKYTRLFVITFGVW
jgi:hypothetical protein